MKKDSLYVFLFTDCMHASIVHKVLLGGNSSINSISQNCFTMSSLDLFHPALTDSFSATIYGTLKLICRTQSPLLLLVGLVFDTPRYPMKYEESLESLV